MTMNKRVLITGASGCLGSNLVGKLIEQGTDPSLITAFIPEASPLGGLEGMHGITIARGDVRDSRTIHSAIQDKEIVFHVAGSTTFDPFRREMQWLVNVEGTRNVLEGVAGANTVERVVFTSTVNTLGAPNPRGSLGNEETSPYAPETKSIHTFSSRDEYLEFADAVHEKRVPNNWWKRIGVGYYDSKLAAHELVTRAWEENGLPVTSVLPGTFFGPRDHFIGGGTYILLVYQQRMPGFIESGSTLVHVLDVVSGHLLAALKGKPGERYIITGRENDNRFMGDILHVIAEVIEAEEPEKKLKKKWVQVKPRVAMIAAKLSEAWSRLSGAPCLLSQAMVRAGRIISFYSHEKATMQLGYSPKFSFREAVADHFRYYKEHGMLDQKHMMI